MSEASFPYDVFISYSRQDRAWVRKKLLSGLEVAGLKVIIDYRDFRIGAPSVIEMERAVTQSRKTVLVLSPAYMGSAWAEFENLMVQTLDPANRDMRLVPLRLAEVDLPVRIAYLNYVDFSDPDPEEIEFAWARLLAALQAPDSQAALAADVAPPPSPPSPAAGHEDECADLRQTLDLARRALRHLQRQKVVYGLATPPHILIEIEDKEQEIRDLQAQLDSLECA